MEFFEKIKNKFKEKQDKKLYAIFLLGCIGILMVSVSDFFDLNFEDKKEENINSDENTSVMESKLEKRLEEEISKISGAGKTSVMITLDSSKEYFYAQNSSEDIDETEVKKEHDFVITEGENGDTPIILKTKEAKVRGVLIICEGGENALVREKIIESVCALLDIPSNHVSVAKMALS